MARDRRKPAQPTGIKAGQIPDWRPGAVFWKPLPDGREITVYPIFGNKARLCVGPLADPTGYDIAYRYPNINAAIHAANEWDSETDQEPPDYENIDFRNGGHITMPTPPLDPAPAPSAGAGSAASYRIGGPVGWDAASRVQFTGPQEGDRIFKEASPEPNARRQVGYIDRPSQDHEGNPICVRYEGVWRADDLLEVKTQTVFRLSPQGS